MKKKFTINWHKILLILGLAIISLIIVYFPINYSTQDLTENLDQEFMEGVILDIEEEKMIEGFEGYEDLKLIQTLKVLVTKGSAKGQEVSIENDNDTSLNNRLFEEGDKVILVQNMANGEITQTYINDYLRRDKLFWLFVIFVIVVVGVSRWQGLSSLLGMAFTFLVIFKIILPLILNGTDPILTAIIGSIFILPAIFFLSHGINRKSIIAISSTFLTLILTGILAKIFITISQLTGFSSDEVALLSFEAKQNINFQGLLLAGIIISVLGVLDDVTVSQTSVVQQLKAVNQKLKFKELYKRAMIVGRDHTSSMINTLILVYTGASLPLLLLFLDNSQSLIEAVNYDFMAEEVVQTLVGSIGLLLAVPITSLLACLYIRKKS